LSNGVRIALVGVGARYHFDPGAVHQQERVYYKDKRPGGKGSGAAHTRAPSITGLVAAQAAADVDVALELGRE
jgi:hypothetical protein